MQYCIQKCIVIIVSAYYNKVIKIYYILIRKRGENNMEIAMAVLKFIGGAIPLIQELLKAFM
ncbi:MULTISPECIES: hypothetical protein [Bacillus cereus group]|uniref:Uncharacterized protein n=1 Tax=Bacillus cereus VD154 TaxID=1053238 RepID=A0A9W5L5M9_BACCE|nr:MULTISPECIES: hypothetical protein [Bacillus cereus group]MEB8735053.1 hypothetical protein [Bacillus cereus]EEM44866.1 hypothetical protein bthur0005_52970 [Bacillus thuringiensis serovar pakistani str. T13001]EJR77664.1 hypothetical protein IK5_00388 [Bacillus cereus VD154]MEB8748394.1 hypothetical protein [Bacillus cereus]MEB8762204.1 hypothetical protein [Bacillus cereus]